jgi:hypothetical protein
MTKADLTIIVRRIRLRSPQADTTLRPSSGLAGYDGGYEVQPAHTADHLCHRALAVSGDIVFRANGAH